MINFWDDATLVGDFIASGSLIIHPSGLNNQFVVSPSGTYVTGDHLTINDGYFDCPGTDGGINALALGMSASAQGLSSTSLGVNSKANAQNSTAVGVNATASGISSSAYGVLAVARGQNSIAIGSLANTYDRDCVAIGGFSTSTGSGTVALGYNADATQVGSMAVGYNAQATHMHSIAIGHDVETTASGQILVGHADQYLEIPGDVNISGIITNAAMAIVDGLAFQKPDLTIVDDSGLQFDVVSTIGGNMDFIIDGVKSTLDCTTGAGVGGAARVTLSAGADANNPTTNYIYATDSGGTASLNTSTSLPTGAFAWIAKVIVPDATTWGTTGAYSFQRYTEAFQNSSRGALSHEREKLRAVGAIYISGGDPTVAITGGSPDTVHVEVAEAAVYQLHRQTFPATATGPYYDGNGTTPYASNADLSSVLTDQDGNSMSGKAFNLVIWGAINITAGECKLFVNRPTASYALVGSALADADNTADMSVPDDFRSTAFLIARVVLSHSPSGGGTWTEEGVFELLGVPPGVRSSGSSADGQYEFLDTQFRVLDNTDTTKEMAFELSPLTTATVRTYTAPDIDGTLILDSAADFNSDVLINSGLIVAGDTGLVGDVSVGGDVVVSGTVTGHGNAFFNTGTIYSSAYIGSTVTAVNTLQSLGALTVTNNATITGNVTVGGTFNGYNMQYGAPAPVGFGLRIGGSVTDTALPHVNGNIYIPLVSGLIWGISAAANATPPIGATCDLDLWINGADQGGQLTLQLNNSTYYGHTMLGSGIAINPNDRLQVKATTNGSWTNNNTAVDLFITSVRVN